MTTNAFLLFWCDDGLEAAIPITQYENMDKFNLVQILSEKPKLKDPIPELIRNCDMRARFNTDRHYKLYAIDCDDVNLTEQTIYESWEKNPVHWIELVTERGVPLI